MSDKLKPEGCENIPTPERVSEEKRGATSQDGQSPGKDGGKDGQKAESSEPSIGDSEPDPADNGERSAKMEEKINNTEARAMATEAANNELRAKMVALENQVYRMEKAADNAAMQNERERERGMRRIEAAFEAASAPGTTPGEGPEQIGRRQRQRRAPGEAHTVPRRRPGTDVAHDDAQQSSAKSQKYLDENRRDGTRRAGMGRGLARAYQGGERRVRQAR